MAVLRVSFKVRFSVYLSNVFIVENCDVCIVSHTHMICWVIMFIYCITHLYVLYIYRYIYTVYIYIANDNKNKVLYPPQEFNKNRKWQTSIIHIFLSIPFWDIMLRVWWLLMIVYGFVEYKPLFFCLYILAPDPPYIYI